ncbi:MAG TPA: ribulose-phosphate 3-epimerase [Elusimicrobia bacterium]|nr:ribulose-phosphate 3-epimerase [Elusimicrobiota bacterium]
MTIKPPFPRPCGKISLVPSVLSADFSRLESCLKKIEASADWVQVDIMDGHFVPNLSFGPDFARAVAGSTCLGVDAHLMVERPGKFIDAFAAAGARLITVHAEAEDSLFCLKRIHSMGLAAGVALRPKTPFKRVASFLEAADLVLIMTVEPGFGGQRFISAMLNKIAAARRAINASGRKIWLQVDGGINSCTAKLAVKAGADSLVMGSAVFGARNPAGFLRGLRLKLNVGDLPCKKRF